MRSEHAYSLKHDVGNPWDPSQNRRCKPDVPRSRFLDESPTPSGNHLDRTPSQGLAVEEKDATSLIAGFVLVAAFVAGMGLRKVDDVDGELEAFFSSGVRLL